ncbi:DUF2254 domain-containing protein [uncultured Marinobacter sp.]|uniref:DUF2254 domain-containing protein n=1 Tax=uncultured Marinobacter sp. TaxID=187379 RepID=UPI00261AAD85|nr:DUF2254 domain-containing protein [uncultured Marinobacter sp.]
MRGQFFKYWNRVRSSFWFIPAGMAGLAVALALVSVTVDKPLTEWLSLNLGWTFTGGAEGASAVLGIVAGSMITIAGVVFSMTLVALSLASSQLGPRLLRSFMRDSTTQVVLGTFIATFLYCLLVLRTIRRAEEVAFVPHLSVTLGVLLAVASVGVLIYFIHHVSVSIQANETVARISKELLGRIDQLFPEHLGRGAPMIPTEAPDEGFLEAFEKHARPVGAGGDGYLQFIDGAALLALSVEEDLVIRLERKPGAYVVASCPLALIWPASRASDRLTDQVRSLFVLGNQRSSDQDIEFGMNQLVEIAVRALSPSLNDPFTAITCVDHLGSVLCRLATRAMPSRYRHDYQNQLRVIAPANTFPEITDAAFNQVRQYSRSSVAVTIRLLETIAVVAGFAHRPEDRATLLRHAEMIARGAMEELPEKEDRRAVEERCQAAIQLCSATATEQPHAADSAARRR